MAKGKSTWKYNKLLTARRNYFADGSGIQKLDIGPATIPLSTATTQGLQLETPNVVVPKKNFITKVGDMIGGSGMSAIGNVVGKIGGNLIGGGLESGAGNVISGLSNIASAIPGPWGAVASAGLGIVGGITNRLFGSKLNQKNINLAESDIDRMNASALSDVSSFDALASKMSTTVGSIQRNKDFYGKDGVFSNKVGKIQKDLEEKARVAGLRQDLAILNNAEDLNADQLMGLEQNYAAFGGPLFASGGSIHIKPENRGKFTETKRRTGKTTEELTHSSNPLTRKRAIFAQNARKWHHAFGGELNTNGADFSNGMIFVNNGGSHESNPFEGVPMGIDPEGTPNLVEEGETIFNDYVFSKRLNVPKAIRDKYKLRGTNKLSFADASKLLAKESEERPNDPISKRGMQALMSDLANAQESLRNREEENQYANGGNVNKFDGKSTMSNMIRRKANASQDDYWNALMGSQLLSRLQALDALEGDERAKAIDAFIAQANSIQDSYYNDIYNSGVTWGGRARVGEGRAHQTTWNDAGYNNYTNYGDWFGARNNTGDRATTWVDNNIGDLTLLRNLGDSRYLSEAKAREIRDLATKLGMTYSERGDGNTLMYFGRNQEPVSTPIETPAPEDKPKEEPKTYTSDYKPEDINLGRNKAEPLRYMPAIGYGIATLTDALGLTNKPDYSSADAILNAVRNSGTYQPVKFNPIGNYLRYSPFDRDYYINKLNAEAGATRRALLQNAGLNRGAGMAAILAADNNAQNQLGVLARQAEEYNLAQRQQVADFNRGTNMANSQGFLQADIANQKALAELRDYSLKGTMAAAQMREAARQAADASKSANISGLFQSLGDIGYEAKNDNMLRRALERGIFSPGAEKVYTDKAKRGGKLRKRKGLTF